MLDVQVKPISNRAFEMMGNVEGNFQRGIRQGWYRIGDQLSAQLSDDVLSKNKTGRTYIRRIKGGARRRHRASAPGESPANRTGQYRRSRGYEIRGWQQLEFGVRADHGIFLEEGTKNMAPRPGVQNAVEKRQNIIPPTLEGSIGAEF